MQTTRITLPEHPDKPGEEQWAELRAVSELRGGDKKAVRGAVVMRFGDDDKIVREFSMADDYARREALIRRLVVNWSLPEAHPQADPEVLGELPLAIYDALIEATEEHFKAVDFTEQKTPSDGVDSSG